jgi:hypothetical protein
VLSRKISAVSPERAAGAGFALSAVMPNLAPHPRLVAPLAAQRRSRSLSFDEPPTRPVESIAPAYSEMRWDPSSARVELGDEDILEVDEDEEQRDQRAEAEEFAAPGSRSSGPLRGRFSGGRGECVPDSPPDGGEIPSATSARSARSADLETPLGGSSRARWHDENPSATSAPVRAERVLVAPVSGLLGARWHEEQEELGATSAYPWRSLPPPPVAPPPLEVRELRFVVTAGFQPGEIVLRPLGADEPPPPDAPIAMLDPSCNFDAFRIQKLLAVER